MHMFVATTQLPFISAIDITFVIIGIATVMVTFIVRSLVSNYWA